MPKNIQKILLWASGEGTNVENLYHYFKTNPQVELIGVLCNNAQAGVIKKCQNLNIPIWIFPRKSFVPPNHIVLEAFLKAINPDWLLLVGFLQKVPESIVINYFGRIINIHPSLLPKFGGKNMYGHFVHQAVIEAKETKSGITIHYVNSHYDKGAIIFQKSLTISAQETPISLAKKIQALEYHYLPKVIEAILYNKKLPI